MCQLLHSPSQFFYMREENSASAPNSNNLDYVQNASVYIYLPPYVAKICMKHLLGMLICS